MSISKTLAASALVLALVLGSAGAASAAWVAKDTVVKKNHFKFAPAVNHLSKGEEVMIVGEYGGWYKIKIPGPDGWVGKSAIGFEKPGKGWGKGKWGNGWGNNGGWGNGSGGGSFCINGEKAQFCISGNN